MTPNIAALTFDAATLAIGEGGRNTTLSRFAGRALIRYGDTEQAQVLFDRKVALRDPPLPAAELEASGGQPCGLLPGSRKTRPTSSLPSTIRSPRSNPMTTPTWYKPRP